MEGKNPSAPSYGFQPPPTYDQTFATQQGQPQPQQPIYYPPQNAAQVVTVITNSSYGPDPVVATCPSCLQQTQTRLDYESSTKTHLMAFVICLLCWPCFWVPYAVDSCKNTNHYCSSCGAYLGTYRG